MAMEPDEGYVPLAARQLASRSVSAGTRTDPAGLPNPSSTAAFIPTVAVRSSSPEHACPKPPAERRSVEQLADPHEQQQGPRQQHAKDSLQSLLHSDTTHAAAVLRLGHARKLRLCPSHVEAPGSGCVPLPAAT